MTDEVYGIDIIEGITPEGDVLMSVCVRCGGDMHLAGDLALMLRGILTSAFEAAFEEEGGVHVPDDGLAQDIDPQP